ncbi:MAG: hypothetical protein QOH97_2322 [Actinoplanes sp.]|jgi:hypothetical protein|nr:hypothetical protein [Actinoplanes sp.]
MVDVQTRPEEPAAPRDRTTRTAALWATAVAVPIMLLVGVLIFSRVITTAERAPSANGPAAAVTTPAVGPSAPVAMAAPKLSTRAAEVCLAFTAQLPATVRGLPARTVSAGPEQNAAYGEPPITVACGLPQPAMCATLTGAKGCVPLDTELLNMNAVCWYADQQTGQTTFTTMDRAVPVTVIVPTSYRQGAQWANEFSDIVVETDASITKGVPTGCV